MGAPAGHRWQILVAALLFSTGGAVVKASEFGIWQIACFRSSIAAVTLALLVPQWRRFEPRAALVGLAYAVTMINFVAANKLTTAANTIFLQATAPMYLLVLGPWLLRERTRRPDLTFAVVLAGGMALFFVGIEPAQDTAPNPLLGNVVAATSGLSWALTLLGLRWLGRTAGPTADPAGAAVVYGNVIAGLATLGLALPVGAARPQDWAIVGYLGIFQVGLAYVFMTRGMRSVPAFETSLLLLLEPVAATLWAWLFLAERPGPWSLAGSALILTATAHRVLRRRNRPP